MRHKGHHFRYQKLGCQGKGNTFEGYLCMNCGQRFDEAVHKTFTGPPCPFETNLMHMGRSRMDDHDQQFFEHRVATGDY